MPEITQIKPQKKKKDRLNIFIGDKFAFSISIENLLKFKLKPGTNITYEDLEKIIKLESLNKFKDYALNFLSYRPRSEKEVKDYLVKKLSKIESISYSVSKDSPIIDHTLKFLQKHNFINDIDFAKWLITSRAKSKPKGIKAIKVDLIRHGISKNLIEQMEGSLKENVAIAYRAIEKKLARFEKLAEDEKKRKIYNYLAYRGFSHDTIKKLFAFLEKKR